MNKYTVTRLTDGDYKDYSITVENTTNPSPDGIAVKCGQHR